MSASWATCTGVCGCVCEPHWTDEAGAWKRRGCVIMGLIEVSHNICTYKERKWVNKWDGKFGEREPWVAAHCWRSPPSGLFSHWNLYQRHFGLIQINDEADIPISEYQNKLTKKKFVRRNQYRCWEMTGLHKENTHRRWFVLWSSRLCALLFLHSLQIRSASELVGLSTCKVKGHLGWEEWALNDRKIPHTFSTCSTQNSDLSCPPWVFAHWRH